MTIPPLSLGITKGAEWLKALNAEMFTYGQSHGYMNKNADHTSVHALAGRLQAGPSGNLELTVPSSLIKGVFDALDEPGAAFGAMMGKLAAGEAPVAPQPSARDIQIHNARMELQRKGQMVRDAAGGNGAYGTSRGTMKDGVIQPGATFTRQEGQQSQRPLPGAGGQINTPPVPRGMQPVPPASSPVMESKTPKRLF